MIKRILKNLIETTYQFLLLCLPDFLLPKIIQKLHYLISITKKTDFFTRTTYTKIKVENVNFFLSSGEIESYINPKNKDFVYEYPVIKCLQAIFNYEKNSIFIDIGACKGFFGIYASKYLKKNAFIYAIESNPKYFAEIESSVKFNNIKNLTTINVALTNVSKKMKIEGLAVSKKENSFNLDKSKNSHENFINNRIFVKGERLDTLLSDLDIKPNIAKIDVHGSEGLLLEGMSSYKNFKYIILELHDNTLLSKYSPGYNRKKILEMLNGYNYNCYMIAPFRVKRNWEELTCYEDNIFIDYKKLLYLNININNIDDTLFYRVEKEILILCLKKEINIEEIDIFNLPKNLT